jgi:galactofuranose transport system substrate-binding protein
MNTPTYSLKRLLSLTACAALVAGCGGEKSPETGEPGAPKKEGKMTMGFSQIGAESGWRTANTDSIKKEAENRGVDLKFADAQQKQENQIKALRSFIAQGVDIIAFSPVVETGWEPVLREIKQANIPVILTDRAVDVSDDSLYVAFIGSDFVEEGKRAGDWLAKKMNGKANIAELQGTPGAAPAIDRKKGFEEAISKHPEMKIIKSQSGNFTRAQGKEVFETFLKSPEAGQINALFAHNDDMALGAIQAIKEAGKQPGKDIVIVSIDGVKDAFKAMVAGELNCSVECNPLLGPQLFDTAEKVMKGEQVPKRIEVKEGVYDETNAKDVIDQRQY